MEGLPSAVSEIAKGLRPAGLWYASVTAIVGLLLWSYQDLAFEAWPAPLRYLTWLYLCVTVLALPYIHLTGFALKKIADRTAENADRPVLPPQVDARPAPPELVLLPPTPEPRPEPAPAPAGE